MTTSINPTVNSRVERTNAMIEHFKVSRGNTFEEIKSKIQTHLNITANRTVKSSPFEIIYHYNPVEPVKKNFTEIK